MNGEIRSVKRAWCRYCREYLLDTFTRRCGRCGRYQA